MNRIDMMHRVVVTGPESEVRRFQEKVIRPCEEDGQECLVVTLSTF